MTKMQRFVDSWPDWLKRLVVDCAWLRFGVVIPTVERKAPK